MTDLQVGERVRVIDNRVAFCMRGYTGTVESVSGVFGFPVVVRLDTPRDVFDGVGGYAYGFFADELVPITEVTP